MTWSSLGKSRGSELECTVFSGKDLVCNCKQCSYRLQEPKPWGDMLPVYVRNTWKHFHEFIEILVLFFLLVVIQLIELLSYNLFNLSSVGEQSSHAFTNNTEINNLGPGHSACGTQRWMWRTKDLCYVLSTCSIRDWENRIKAFGRWQVFVYFFGMSR